LIDLDFDVCSGLADLEDLFFGDDLAFETRCLLDAGRVEAGDALGAAPWNGNVLAITSSIRRRYRSSITPPRDLCAVARVDRHAAPAPLRQF
jgi:hypothetical protein